MPERFGTSQLRNAPKDGVRDGSRGMRWISSSVLVNGDLSPDLCMFSHEGNNASLMMLARGATVLPQR